MGRLHSVYRSHVCSELRVENVGQEVTLSGWVHRKRDHGGVVFVDLRDHYGMTQVVFSGEGREKIQQVRPESVIRVHGTVVRRAADMVNPKIVTGEIEVHTSDLELLSPAQVLPFQIAEDDNAPETARLRYRFLDLRRERLHANVVLRAQVIAALRDIMQRLGFMEVQTPILTSSSPEGARDFLVPSRFHPGKFFALPQAPQQFKQLLMVAGFDRYFQIAPCFRDEDPRADRSPGEFYQLDLEMSFVEQDDVFEAVEQCFGELFGRFSKWPVSATPFPRVKYADAMQWYGTDKPDLRVPVKMVDVSDLFRDTEFKVFRSELERRGALMALPFKVDVLPPRKFFDDTVENFKKASGRGLGYVIFDADGHKGTIAKFMSEAEVSGLRQAVAAEGITIVFLAAGPAAQILPPLARFRVEIADYLGQAEREAFRFCWITDFPMYERDEKTGQIVFSHNPFSMPQGGMQALEERDPLSILAWQYDLVCNGVELSSGAIRNHRPDIMYKAFEIAGYAKETVDRKFGGMIRAFNFGAPPHGGIAPGVDRIVMLLAGEKTIREVIAFPMAQSVEDLMMGAPSEVSHEQLAEVHIEVKLPEKEQQG